MVIGKWHFKAKADIHMRIVFPSLLFVADFPFLNSSLPSFKSRLSISDILEDILLIFYKSVLDWRTLCECKHIPFTFNLVWLFSVFVFCFSFNFVNYSIIWYSIQGIWASTKVQDYESCADAYHLRKAHLVTSRRAIPRCPRTSWF